VQALVEELAIDEGLDQPTSGLLDPKHDPIAVGKLELDRGAGVERIGPIRA